MGRLNNGCCSDLGVLKSHYYCYYISLLHYDDDDEEEEEKDVDGLSQQYRIATDTRVGWF
jgi:hypothetical protein